MSMRKLVTGLLAIAVAGTAAACSSGSSGGSGGTTTLKIITWVNPPAVKAINTIDAEFHKKYPNINVKLQTAVNVNGPYETLLQQTVTSGSADIVTSVTQLQALPLHPSRSNETPWQYWSTNNAFAPARWRTAASSGPTRPGCRP
jgi:raffinose/stachyose/melibiose transport system substrate-binding protein